MKYPIRQQRRDLTRAHEVYSTQPGFVLENLARAGLVKDITVTRVPRKRDDKPRPLLADRYLHRKREPLFDTFYHPRALGQIEASLKKANRFVFDEEASERVAKVVMDVPDLLIREYEFARAPYDITWIEYAAHVYWDFFRRQKPDLYAAQGYWGEPTTADHTVGFLIDHNRVNTITGGTYENPDATPRLSPLQYRLHTEWPEQAKGFLTRQTRIGEDALLVFACGSSYDKLTPEQRWRLVNNTTIEIIPFNPQNPAAKKAEKDPSFLHGALRGAVGDPRSIIAFLLMLNRPSITRYVFKNTARGWYRAKSIPYLSHNTVHVNLDAVESMKLIGTPHDDPLLRRRHKVRGHFCHDETAREYARIAGCIHDWVRCHQDWTQWPEAKEDETDWWRCKVCEGKRWWREDHERGDSTKGYVIHDKYDITNE